MSINHPRHNCALWLKIPKFNQILIGYSKILIFGSQFGNHLKSLTMANNHFLSSIYGIQTPLDGSLTFVGGTTGIPNSFPSAGTRIYQAPSGTVGGNGSVTINSVIELLPTGLNKDGFKFFSADTVATLNTAAT